LPGNIKAIRQRVAYIEQLDPQYAPFARRLIEMTESFQTRAIVALVA